MRFLRPILLLLLAAPLVDAETFTWTGGAGDRQYTNPANWVGGVVPPNNGTATLVFGNTQNGDVVLPLILDVAQLQFQNTALYPYSFGSEYLTLLNVRDGITSSTAGGSERVGESIILNLPGSQTVNVVSGSLEVAGAIFGNALIKSGAGTLRISGTNLLTNGTQVQSGSLLFSSLAALPAAGLISVNSGGYVGAENAQTLKVMLAQLDRSSFRGTLGLDSAPGSTTPAVYSDQIDVTDLGNYAGLGSTTSARLTGNFRINANQDYRFGGGAGTLYVETNLNSTTSNLLVQSAFGQPLTVVLRGSNNFGGTLNVLNSVLVLDSTQAVTPGRVLNLANPGYIGATERFATSTASFLSLLHATSPNAIAGLDSSNPASSRTISDAIDLSVGGTRTGPYYLGTSTKVTLTGQITPTVGDALYLTAVKGGQLIVGSTLGSNIPGLVVGQANSFDPKGGIVEITGHNNYTGGTKILGGTLRVSNDAALGTGAVSVGRAATLDVNAGTRFTNPFSLDPGARLAGNGSVGTAGGAVFGPGAILSPGGVGRVGTLNFSTGLTLGAGSVIEFDIKNTTGGPGSDWDFISVRGGPLNLTATSLSPITINLTSLYSDGSAGLLTGFDGTQSYNWTFASGSVSGFSNDKFVFSTVNFANNLGGGSFFMNQGNAGLSISFTPVPEPGTYVLLAMGLAVVAVFELRRRKK